MPKNPQTHKHRHLEGADTSPLTIRVYNRCYIASCTSALNASSQPFQNMLDTHDVFAQPIQFSMIKCCEGNIVAMPLVPQAWLNHKQALLVDAAMISKSTTVSILLCIPQTRCNLCQPYLTNRARLCITNSDLFITSLQGESAQAGGFQHVQAERARRGRLIRGADMGGGVHIAGWDAGAMRSIGGFT